MKKTKKVLSLALATAMLGGTALNVSAAELRDLFDAEYYAERHADVKAALGTDPDVLFDHYVTYGVKEGRKGSHWFDVESYRSRYADLENAFGDDWAAYVNHYLTYGISEGRDGGGREFDAISYANRYEDVKEAYGYDLKLLLTHYQVFGINEGRMATSQAIVDVWEEEARIREEEARIREEKEKNNENNNENNKYPCTEIVPAGDGGWWENVYDANGNHIKETQYDANGQVIGYATSEYDANGNVTERIAHWSDGTKVKETHSYDSAGNPKTHTVHYYDSEDELTNYTIITIESITCVVSKNYMGDGTYMGKTIQTNDADGVPIGEDMYDATDVLTSRYIYNADGTSTRYDYFLTGEVYRKTIYYNNGMIAEEIVYDTNGNILNEVHYDEEGNAIP